MGCTPRKCCFPLLHTASSLQRDTYDDLQGAAETRILWVSCYSGHLLTNNNPATDNKGKGKKILRYGWTEKNNAGQRKEQKREKDQKKAGQGRPELTRTARTGEGKTG